MMDTLADSSQRHHDTRGKIVLFILIGLGVLLIVAGLWWLAMGQGKVTTPSSLAGLPVSRHIAGRAALDDIERLHDTDIPMVDGAITFYGDGQVVLWISSTWLRLMATGQIEAMTARIAEGRSPFTLVGTRQFDGRTVYELTGMGQVHYYFQFDRQVVWLAASPSLAEQSLDELLTYLTKLP